MGILMNVAVSIGEKCIERTLTMADSASCALLDPNASERPDF